MERLPRLSLSKKFGVFRHKNFRLFFMGESISLCGLWIQRVAMNWLVYVMTGSTFMLGLIDFATQAPVLFLSGITGAVMEGRDLRKLVLFCQVLSCTHAFTLAALTLSGVIRYEYIFVLAVILGISDSFELPARQAIIPRLIDDKNDIGKGVATMSMLFNLTRLVGPSIGGFVIAAVGEGICFLVNGFSYIPTLVALLLMRFTVPLSGGAAQHAGVMRNLKDGIKYAKEFLPIRNTLVGMTLISFFGFPYITLTTVFARDILGGQPYTLGFLMAAIGLGALLGALVLSFRKSPVGLMRVMGFGALGFGAFVVLFSISTNFYLSAFLVACTAYCSVTCVISCSTLVLILADDDKCSRMVSLRIVATVGATPLGSLCTGAIARYIGAPLTLGCWGAITLFVGVWLLKINSEMRALARPVYVNKGYL